MQTVIPGTMCNLTCLWNDCFAPILSPAELSIATIVFAYLKRFCRSLGTISRKPVWNWKKKKTEKQQQQRKNLYLQWRIFLQFLSSVSVRRVVFENLRLTLSSHMENLLPRMKVMNVRAALVMPCNCAFFFNPFAVPQDDERNYWKAGKTYHRKSFTYLNGDDS